MLDKMLEVAYRAEQKKTASRQLIDKLKEFSIDELAKLASGDPDCKLAFVGDCMKSDTWIDKYKGTPLFAKAIELEKALLQIDMEEQAQRAQLPPPTDNWAKRDAIRLQQRMLDLDLAMSDGGAPAEAALESPEAKEEKAIGELQQAQAQEKVEGGGADAAHEATEDEALELLEQAHGGGGEGAAGPPQQQAPQQPPKPKVPPQQQAQGGEGEGEEDEEDEKKDKPKGMSVEVKQSAAKLASCAVEAGRFLAKTAGAESKLKREIAKKHPGLAKEAADNPEGHHLRRALLGNPVSAAIEARPGERLNAYGEATGHQLAEGLKGGLKGGLIGGGAGLLGGAGLAVLNRNPAHLGSMLVPGAALGGGLGLMAGAIKGDHGREASRIHGARSSQKAPEEKVAFVGALKPMASQLGGVIGAGKNLAQSAYAKGGLGQVASSFGNVAKNFAMKNPMAAAGIAGAGGLLAGKALSN